MSDETTPHLPADPAERESVLTRYRRALQADLVTAREVRSRYWEAVRGSNEHGEEVPAGLAAADAAAWNSIPMEFTLDESIPDGSGNAIAGRLLTDPAEGLSHKSREVRQATLVRLSGKPAIKR